MENRDLYIPVEVLRFIEMGKIDKYRLSSHLCTLFIENTTMKIYHKKS